MSDKIYFGGAKSVTSQYGEFFKLSFSQQDLEEMLNNLNEKGYINLGMNKRREPSQWGQTHSIVLDTWRPTPQTAPAHEHQHFSQAQQDAQSQVPTNSPNFDEEDLDDDTPF